MFPTRCVPPSPHTLSHRQGPPWPTADTVGPAHPTSSFLGTAVLFDSILKEMRNRGCVAVMSARTHAPAGRTRTASATQTLVLTNTNLARLFWPERTSLKGAGFAHPTARLLTVMATSEWQYTWHRQPSDPSAPGHPPSSMAAAAHCWSGATLFAALQ